MLLKINDVEMPSPSKYEVSYQDLDAAGSGRTEAGYTIRRRVRSQVAKLNLGWTNLSQEEVEKVLGAVENESFEVTYWFGNQKTTTMYAGDKNVSLKLKESAASAFWDLSFNLIEM